ncbi:MAG: PAS domain S-box protein, partial [Sphingobacteriales bacterium]
MQEILPQVEEAGNQVLDFSALLLKCDLEGRICQVLHSDFGEDIVFKQGEHFFNLFPGISLLFATDFLAELRNNGKAPDTNLVTQNKGNNISFVFNGIRSGNFLLISGYTNSAPAPRKILPVGTENASARPESNLEEIQKLAKIGSYEIHAGVNQWQVSQQMYSLFGWDRYEEFTNESYLKMVHPDDLPALLKQFETARKKGGDFRMLYRARHRNGHWLTICSTGRAELNNNGKLARIIGAKQDLTQHYSLKNALRESEELYRSVIDSSLDAVVVIDEAGTIVDWNTQATAIFGYTRAEALGKNLDELLLQNVARRSIKGQPGTAESFRHLFRKRLEVLALHKAGNEFLAEVTLTEVKIKGHKC